MWLCWPYESTCFGSIYVQLLKVIVVDSLSVSQFKTEHGLKEGGKLNVGLGNFGDYFGFLVICHHYIFEAQIS